MSHVHIVSYLDDIHVYPEARADEARALHTVAIGANTDSAHYRITSDRWAQVRDELATSLDSGGEIVDHREDAPADV
jgi:hypothetical protein